MVLLPPSATIGYVCERGKWLEAMRDQQNSIIMSDATYGHVIIRGIPCGHWGPRIGIIIGIIIHH